MLTTHVGLGEASGRGGEPGGLWTAADCEAPLHGGRGPALGPKRWGGTLRFLLAWLWGGYGCSDSKVKGTSMQSWKPYTVGETVVNLDIKGTVRKTWHMSFLYSALKSS